MYDDRHIPDAPVLSLDYAFEGKGIWPCDRCLPWHAEVIEKPEGLFIREWHDLGCDFWDDE